MIGAAALLLSIVFMFVPGVRFSACLFFGISLLCLLWLILHRWGEFSIYGNVCKWIFLVGIIAVSAFLLTLEAMVLAESRGDDGGEEVAAVIVLGAGVNGETPSLSLQSRIQSAADYLEDHPSAVAVLSGGQGSGEAISEAEAMRRGLIALGIGADRLWLEDQSANTAENFAFSAELLKKQGVDLSQPLAVVTNDFHLFRAKLLARKMGISDPVGVPANLPWWLDGNYYVREAFASVKTLLFD